MSRQQQQPKCEARTNSGRRCENDALPGKKYCHITSHRVRIDKQLETQNRTPKRRLCRVLKRPITRVIIIAGFVSSILSLVPTISIVEGPKLISSNPITSRFIVKNENKWCIEDIKFFCGAMDVRGRGRVSGIYLGNEAQDVPELCPNQNPSTTFTCWDHCTGQKK